MDAADGGQHHRDQYLLVAIGEELVDARRRLQISRPKLVELLPIRMPTNTYACYEQALRPIPLPKLVMVCEALGEDVGDLVNRAVGRVGQAPHCRACGAKVDSEGKAIE